MVEFLMAVIRKVKLQKDCYQSVMKTTTKMTVLMTDLGLSGAKAQTVINPTPGAEACALRLQDIYVMQMCM